MTSKDGVVWKEVFKAPDHIQAIEYI